MSYNNFKLDTDSDGIVTMTIDVPNQTMNVWTPDFINEFDKFIDDYNSNDEMKGLVLTSGKENAFLAGADLNMMSEHNAAGKSLTKEAFQESRKLTLALRKMENGGWTTRQIQREGKKAKPAAAAVEGLALGGGLEMCLATHQRFVADNPKIKLGLPEVMVGLLPGAGGTQRTMRLMGLQPAATMCTQGKNLDPKKAKAQGLIHEVVEAGTTAAAAKAWVKDNIDKGVLAPWDVKGFKIPGGGGAMNPKSVQFFSVASPMALQQTKGNYPAVSAILSCMYEGSIVPIDTALRIESKYITKLMMGATSKNMIRTLFLNKNAADKGAGRPEGIPPQDIKKVGVLRIFLL